jgi:hypothetical protein
MPTTITVAAQISTAKTPASQDRTELTSYGGPASLWAPG